MSHKKDKEKLTLRKRLDPKYAGFRGNQPRPVPKPSLKVLFCTVCGKKRNVPLDSPEESFICASCRTD